MELKMVLVMSFLATWASFAMYKLFFDFKKINKIILIASFPFCFFTQWFLWNFLGNWSYIFIVLPVTSLGVSFLFDAKLYKKILAFLFLFLSVLLNYISLIIIVLCIFGDDVDFINSVAYYEVNIIVATIMLIFNIYFCFYKKYKLGSHPLHFLKILIVPIVLISLYILSYEVRRMQFEAKNYLVLAVLIFSVLCFGFYNLVDQLVKISQTNMENKLLKNQTEYYIKRQSVLEENYNSIREVKHNLKHTLLYMQEKFNSGDTSELKSELSSIIKNIEDNQISYTSNASVNFLLNYKLEQFSRKEIKVDVKVDIGKDTLLNEKVLYVILGNILDNALENFNSDNSTLKNLILRMKQDNNNLYIKVANPYVQKISMINKLPKSSKEKDIFHGIGLKSVKNILSKNSGDMKITTENNIFTITVIIFDGAKPYSI